MASIPNLPAVLKTQIRPLSKMKVTGFHVFAIVIVIYVQAVKQRWKLEAKTKQAFLLTGRSMVDDVESTPDLPQAEACPPGENSDRKLD